jgi:hypothetical protein
MIFCISRTNLVNDHVGGIGICMEGKIRGRDCNQQKSKS